MHIYSQVDQIYHIHQFILSLSFLDLEIDIISHLHSSSSLNSFQKSSLFIPSFILSSCYILYISESSYDKLDGKIIYAKDPSPVPTDLANVAASPVNTGIY